MRSILCYLLFAIGGTVTYVCAEEKGANRIGYT